MLIVQVAPNGAVCNTSAPWEILEGDTLARATHQQLDFPTICRQASELIAVCPQALMPLAASEVETILNDGRGVVAIHQGRVVGFVWLRVWGDWPEGRLVLEVRSWVVGDSHKSRGLGTALLRQVLRMGRTRCESALIIARVNTGNDGAYRLFVRLGAQEIALPPVVRSYLNVSSTTFDVTKLL